MVMNGSGIAPDEDRNQCFKIDIESLEPARECCIYKVPRKLRKIREEAYTPQLISIGPFHHDKEELADMQKQKIRYRHEFFMRIGKEKFEKLEIYVKDQEKDIRKCYADQASQLSSEKFIEIILDDAIFIIELFLRNHKRDTFERDFLLDQLWLKNAIKLDFQLLENQLPYFVLEELHILAFRSTAGEISPSFLSLSCKFFGYTDKFAEICNQIEGNLKHFLDLRRYHMVGVHSNQEQEPSKLGAIKEGSTPGITEDLPSAATLNESGVTFKPIPKSSDGLLEIKFEEGTRCIPFFSGDRELHIRRITIEDCTECLLRNLMALEQCHYPSSTHICNYIDLIDSLINTSKDVDLLVENGIISNRVGDHASISEMFNKLCLQIAKSDSRHKSLILDLKAYHDRWWNRTKAALVTVYFRDVWRGTATAVATILVLLTVLQTMQRLWGGWSPR